MPGNKRHSNMPRSAVAATPPQTAVPIPAVSTVCAAGESTFSHDSRPSTPVRKSSTTSLATFATRSTASLRGTVERSTTSHENDDSSRRSSWFKKGTWPLSGHKSAAVSHVAHDNHHDLDHSDSELPNSPYMHAPNHDYGPTYQKSSTRLHEDYGIGARTPTGTLSKKPSLMMPPPPSVAPPQETCPPSSSRPETPAPAPAPTPAPAPAPVIPEPEPEPEPEPTPAPVEIPEPEPAPEEPTVDNTTEAAETNTPAVQGGGLSSWVPLVGWWYGSQPAPTPEPTSAATPAPKPEDKKEPSPEPIKVIEEEPEVEEEPVVEPVKEPEPEVKQIQPTSDDIIKANRMRAESSAGGSTASIRSVPARPRSWFGLWGGGYEAVPESAPDTKPDVGEVPAVPIMQAPTRAPSIAEPVVEEEAPPTASANVSMQSGTAPSTSAPANRGYGWFWSSARNADTNSIRSADGEVAVAGAPSEANPQKAKVKQPDMPASSVTKSASQLSLLQQDNCRVVTPKPSNSKLAAAPIPKSDAVNAAAPGLQPSSASVVAAAETNAAMLAASEARNAKQKLQKMMQQQNHLLPAFESCYRLPEQPSVLQRVTGLFRHTPVDTSHLYLSKQPPRIRKAVAIGVHGFFPMKLVRSVLGEPTGTSIRFANHAASSIKRWAEKNGIEVEVEKIALEGEGKVGDRVEMLWKLLQNWMDHVRSADFVLMAAHSQGVVVGMQLLARLIEEGCVDNARIGFTAMAGINLGPFYHLPTSILTGSAKELFEFQRHDSPASKKYVQAIRTVLAQNVRICYVGSIDDQLVPLESSVMTNISHPHIYRAVFIDGRIHAPDFISHLVGFALKLRNLGVTDHGLIRELSTPLAGSLYGGEGHSRIYNDGAVYDLGVRHALETTECPGIPLRVLPFELPTNVNPYFLPWSLRGLLEETIVRTQLSGECTELLEQFEAWKPTSKVLKDVKFRLEGIRIPLRPPPLRRTSLL